MLKIISTLGLAFILTACATSTPYQQATGDRGFGFSDQRIEQNRFRITFRGNSSTPRETVENSILYRAAELTVQEGFDYFVIIENDTEARTTFSTTGSPAFVGGSRFGRGGFRRPFFRRGYAFPYYAYGFGWGGGSGFNSYTREITRYSAVAFVAMFEGEKPLDDVNAFDGREVISNLQDIVLGLPAEQ